MSEPTTKYDEMSDTLYVSFAPGEAATGIEMNEHILLAREQSRKAGYRAYDF